MIIDRDIYSPPPRARSARDDHPTLLVSWWCTGFALAVILVRLAGRMTRSEKLYKEDKIMGLSIIPLLARMGLVHVVLIYGTNNAITTGLTPEDIRRREIGSRLVLASRIVYAIFLWTAKFTVAEFLKRLVEQIWKRSYQIGLQCIRWFLAITFVAVVIATLAECQPFNHYWQVVPDPGAKCRQGYAQLITMGTSDTITDIILVVFPISIIIKSTLPLSRKISLIFLFSLSLILVAITIYRVISVVDRHSNQQFRSLLASLEILAAAGVSNAIVLGSFIRDRGVKKRRYRHESIAASSTSMSAPPTRARTITTRNWGSDEDLVRDLGIGGLSLDLVDREHDLPRPAPVALPLAQDAERITPRVHNGYNFQNKPRISASTDETDLKANGKVDEDAIEPVAPSSPPDAPPITPRRMSFFDVGGLLGDDAPARHYPPPLPPTSTVSPLPSPHLLTPGSATSHHHRRSSSAFLQDVGGLLPPGSADEGRESRQCTVGASSVRTSSRPRSEHPPPENAMAELARDVSNTSRRPSPLPLQRLQEEGRESSRPRAEEGTELRDVGGLLA